jgi:hypothetical protein
MVIQNLDRFDDLRSTWAGASILLD